jgi:hypothetical protein
MNPEASQKGKRMLSWSVPVGGIRVTTSPGQDGSTINDEVTGSNQSSLKRLHNDQDKQRFVQRGSCDVATSARLRGARNFRLALVIER